MRHTLSSWFRTSFQFRLLAVFTLLTALLSTLFCSLYVVRESSDQRRHIREKLRQQGLHLAELVRLPLYAEDRVVLQKLAEEAARSPYMRSVTIVAPDGRILAGVNPPGPAEPDLLRETMKVNSSPIYNSVESALTGSRDPEGGLIGTINLERSTNDLSQKTRISVRNAAGAAFIFWLTVSSLSYLLLLRVTRSFTALMHGIDAMKEGDYKSPITILSDDEPGRAARAVNELAAALLERRAENARLTEERIGLERQVLHAQKLESLGIMAGGIAHDFNNLLQEMLGNMEMALMSAEQGSASQKLITAAIASVNRAATLSGLMLTYVGKGFFARKPLNLNDLIRSNIDMLKAAHTTKVSLDLDLADDLPAVIAGEAELQQVIMNLVTNAAEAITEQPGLVRISTGVRTCDREALSASLLDEKPEPGRFVYLEVCDNGCGMDKDTLARIFDPFFTTKFTGRGLGMSAVMGIIKAHNGAICVKSEPGRGTTFTLVLPASDVALPVTAFEASAAAPAVVLAQLVKPFSGVALVVDDEKTVLRTCTKMVELCGFRVITAVDGIDAVTVYREHAEEIAVVLMDLTMPNMDGIAAMHEIFDIRPDARVILSSGFNREELGDRISPDRPPAGFIRKPYSMGTLRQELGRVIPTSGMPAELSRKTVTVPTGFPVRS